MRFLISCLTILICSNLGVKSQTLTCTSGRLFLADQNQPLIHGIDLDDTGDVFTLNVDFPSPRLSVSSNGVLISHDPGTSDQQYNNGVTQFHHTGVFIQPHQDHWEVEKEFPFTYDFRLSGAGGISTSASLSNGYSGIFYGSEQINGPARATFVKMADFGAATSQPSNIKFNIAHTQSQPHGIALALTETRFLTSIANGFAVLDQNGGLISLLNNVTSTSGHCSNYIGSSVIGGGIESAHICGSNVLSIHYNSTTDSIQTSVIENLNLQSISRHDQHNFVVGFKTSLVGQTSVPTLVRFNPGKTLQTAEFHQYASNDAIASYQPCIMLSEPKGSNLGREVDHEDFLVFWPNGRLDVFMTFPSFQFEHSIQVISSLFNGQQSRCSDFSFAVRNDVVFISDSINQHLHKVGIDEKYVQTTLLEFTPSNIVVYHDSKAACAGDQDHHDE